MKKIIICAVLVTASIFSYCFGEETIRLYGATTVAELLNPYKDVVENKTGCTLEIVGNTAGMGLIYLNDRRCDIALTATNLENTITAAKMGKKNINPEGLVVTVFKNDELVFIVNSSNTVTSLTDAQLKKILTGWIINWQEVGGPKLPVTVVADKVTGATRNLIRKELFPDTDFTPNVKEFISCDLIVSKVKDTQGAIAGVSLMHVTPKVKILNTRHLSRPLGFITKGEPSDKIKEVIDTFASLIK
ncbi:MAG: substrate-binding domain-containing protein [Elusimicrobia bacterium]|nr:substrate-binding domain-containing protein [Candidatus Liberimonas magnetica]